MQFLVKTVEANYKTWNGQCEYKIYSEKLARFSAAYWTANKTKLCGLKYIPVFTCMDRNQQTQSIS
jgi:hypothetical protein